MPRSSPLRRSLAIVLPQLTALGQKRKALPTADLLHEFELQLTTNIVIIKKLLFMIAIMFIRFGIFISSEIDILHA